MTYKRFGLFATVAALVVGIFSGVTFSPTAFAAGQTCTWTGGGADTNFSTVANWTNCNGAAPTNDDALVFDASSLSADVTPNNDINGLSVTNITFSGSSSNYYNYAIDGSAITVTGAISNTATYGSDSKEMSIVAPVVLGGDVSVTNVSLNGAISVAGHTLTLATSLPCGMDITGAISGTGAVVIANTAGTASGVNIKGNNSGFTGVFTANADTRVGFYTTASIGQASSVSATSAVLLVGLDGADRTLATATHLGGTLYVTYGHGIAAGCFGSSSPAPSSNLKLTLSNGLELTGNLAYDGDFVDTTVNDPYTTNSHSLTVKSGSVGSITLPSGTIDVQPVTTTYSDDNASAYLTVGNKETAILDGTRGWVTIGYGGVLKGTGTAADGLRVEDGGIVAPGHSPGCLTVDTLTLDGEYQFELGGTDPCTGYDQIRVLNAGASTNAVTLNDSTSVLTTSRYNGYTPTQGQVFTIIDQAGSAAVNGTFTGLPEGATFEQNGVVFKISYVGGDGNDVTLTVMNTPTAPDTGFELIKNNPIMVLAVMAGLGGLLVLLARSRLLQKR